jgi:hypothetical protein
MMRGGLNARAHQSGYWVWPLCVQTHNGALSSFGGRCLGAWEAEVFGASYAESALASGDDVALWRGMVTMATEASVAV